MQEIKQLITAPGDMIALRIYRHVWRWDFKWAMWDVPETIVVEAVKVAALALSEGDGVFPIAYDGRHLVDDQDRVGRKSDRFTDANTMEILTRHWTRTLDEAVELEVAAIQGRWCPHVALAADGPEVTLTLCPSCLVFQLMVQLVGQPDDSRSAGHIQIRDQFASELTAEDWALLEARVPADVLAPIRPLPAGEARL